MKLWQLNPTEAKGHMPLEGHRTQTEVRQDEQIGRVLRKLSNAVKREAARAD